jgi:UDP-3-O-[3-hydroxymyristoyl] glucosamine N-acyltransferase
VALRLDEIVARFGGEIVGAGDTAVSRIDTLQHAGPGDLAFLANPKYRHQLATTRAAAVIMAPPAMPGRAAILTPQPYLYYARVAQWLNPVPLPAAGNSSQRSGGGRCCRYCFGRRQRLDRARRPGRQRHVVIGANCSIGEDVEIGDGTRLAPTSPSMPDAASAPAA